MTTHITKNIPYIQICKQCRKEEKCGGTDYCNDCLNSFSKENKKKKALKRLSPSETKKMLKVSKLVRGSKKY